MGTPNVSPDAIKATLRRTASILTESGVPFALAGGMAAWARGGPESLHDVDFVVMPDDAQSALKALAQDGMRVEHPPERAWLVKAWDGEVLIDIIFRMNGVEIADVIDSALYMEVLGVDMPVMTLEHVFVTKLMAINELWLEYSSVLKLARSLREQVPWSEVRAATASSPFAAAFFTIAEGLAIVDP